MSLVAKVIKALEKAQAAEEEPTAFESMVMLKLVGKLQANTLRAEEESSESSSDNCSEESDESDDDSEDSEDSDGSVVADNKPKRKYTKGPRAKGYALYLKNGGTREKWSNKSDKYKDNYYEKHK
tara:strand:- start:562 stop:936 length:375 start_codon:yes stop_codon:yes gene_type:complete